MKKGGKQTKGPKIPEKKVFNANDYVKVTLPYEQVIQIKQAFDIFDGDGSGTIDPSQLKQAFIDLGFTGKNKFVYQILAELDEDNSGGIDFDEFLRLATTKTSEKDTRVQINKIFKAFDHNKQRKITWHDLKKVSQDLGEEMTDQQIQNMFHRADLDQDGYVTEEDFYNIMTHRVYWDQK